MWLKRQVAHVRGSLGRLRLAYSWGWKKGRLAGLSVGGLGQWKVWTLFVVNHDSSACGHLHF